MSTGLRARLRDMTEAGVETALRRPAIGLDETRAIQVGVDDSGWVSSIELLELDEGLRTVDGLGKAVQGAVTAARMAQLVQEASETQWTPDELRRGRELEEGTRRLSAPRLETVPMSIETLRERYTNHHPERVSGDVRRDRVYRGTSQEDELTVTATWLGGFDSLRVADETWLVQISNQGLRFALREAFAALYQEAEVQ